MKHKAFCSDCGRSERIEIIDGKYKSPWRYYGKININSIATTKYFITLKSDKLEDLEMEGKRVKNESYDPKIKPKYTELWECGCRDKK